MSPAEGRDRNELNIEEVLASIRRLIQTADHLSSPSPFASVERQPPPPELEPFDLPALFRPVAHAKAEPAKAMPAPPPPPSPFLQMSVAPDAASERPQPRVMAQCKDTLIARMGQQTFAQPSVLSFEKKEAVQPDEGGFCLMPMLPPRLSELQSPILGPARGYEIPRAKFGQESFLLGRGAADDDGALDSPAQRSSAPAQSFDVDHTAALLRPILRQWVDDNMKQVFMKALLEEVIAPLPDEKK